MYLNLDLLKKWIVWRSIKNRPTQLIWFGMGLVLENLKFTGL